MTVSRAPALVPLALAVCLAGPGGAVANERVLAQAGGTSGYDPMQRKRTNAPGQATEPARQGDPELGGLPDAPGAEDTYYLCSACHSVALVKQQRISDARWDYLWTWMIEEQGMPEQDQETRATILGYLKAHFSSER